MKRMLFVLSLSIYAVNLAAQQNNWQVVQDHILTPWAKQVNPLAPLPEYPRPQMVRENWKNLNGLWNYKIEAKQKQELPGAYEGKILVPYPVESALSGVARKVGKDSVLWYSTTLSLPNAFANKNVLLHFGAVDWQCDVYVNGKLAGTHQGGYDPFSIDITPQLKKGSTQALTIKVWDPSDDGPQPRGKQVKKPEGIWYTPVTGIWQTVWVEAVPKTYIASTKQTPDIDKSILSVTATVVNAKPGDIMVVSAWDGAQKIAEQEAETGNPVLLKIPGPKLWSPGNPFLYDLKIAVKRNNKVIDEVKTYFAMRKISVGTDGNGVRRMLLNNEFVFQYGPLDQGWWPDGLYTAPTDEALRFDIEKTKAMGFNTIRKHVKVEPARWYNYCDKLGMLVWQDMPSGDMSTGHWDSRPAIEGLAEDARRSEASEKIYRAEWEAIMNALHNFPAIVVWVPFNEGWGQFKTREITEWTMKKDPSRLVNSASGGNFYPAGHIMDLHNYPSPAMPAASLFGAGQVLVLGEFGGLGLPIEDHTWQQKNNWGYQSFKTKEDLYRRYASFIDRLQPLIQKGLSAAIYTQTTDVEVEVNGLMTYDREIIKMPVDSLRQIHGKLYQPLLSPVRRAKEESLLK
jgi:beta-galactosidase/beta-glucuronidase